MIHKSAERMAMRTGLLLAGLLAVTPVFAISGYVIDEKKNPIEGAEICYSGHLYSQSCVNTNAKGFFLLPDRPGHQIRVSARGFVPRKLPPVDPAEPVMLDPAASIKVLLEDAKTGEALDGGRVWLLYPSGRKLGPFPPSANGVQIGTLEPGEVVVMARRDGYGSFESEALKLTAGELVTKVIALEPTAGN